CAGGIVHAASEDILMVQIATSVSDREAHDFGGGGGAFAPEYVPATTVIPVVLPAESVTTLVGTSLSQSIAKCGSTNLSSPGRLSQIWNSSSRFGPFESSNGNISEWTIPFPAVSHCTSPGPKRAVAPRESE